MSFITYWEEEMSDDRNPTNGEPAKTEGRQQLDPQDFELAKAIRSEVVGYVFKGGLIALTPVLGFLGVAIWGYIEWRLPQLAGGVPRGAVVAFAQSCPPKEQGWAELARARSHVIVGSVPDTEVTDGTYPKHLHAMDERGEFAEYVFTKAPPRESRQLAANELPVNVPALLALTYCEKTNAP
jgi:hypothetical protein